MPTPQLLWLVTMASRPASWGTRWRSGGSTCRLTCSSARAPTGTSTGAASTPSRRSSRIADCDPKNVDPIPVAVFLDYAQWFRERKSLDIDERLLTDLTKPDGAFVAMMEDGTTITADKVLAAPGISHFMNLPAWYADVPPSRRSHTSELVAFDELAGARVVIIGGRQSAYEWAALLC